MENDRQIAGVLILADESSDWRVAGLRQLDRLSLGLNEFAGSLGDRGRLPVCRYGTDVPRSLGPTENPRLPHLSITDSPESFSAELAGRAGDVLLLDSRLVIGRGAFGAFVSETQRRTNMPAIFVRALEIAVVAESRSAWMSQIAAAGRAMKSRGETSETANWYYLCEASEIEAAEKRVLNETGKSQDGFVARYLNRPVSRPVSRFLLRFPISPNQWTITTTLLAIAGASLLMRGDRLGFVVGAILFHFLSVLDGCDGEIARAKYLDSDAGAKLDGICDRLATMLLTIGLGIGLARQPGIADALRWFYPWEGIIAALLLGVSETYLQRTPIEEDLQRAEPENNLYPGYVRTHREIFNSGDQLKIFAIKHSGMVFFGEDLTSFFVQATKRDVFNLAFALLILCGWPQAVLHILATVAFAIAIFALRDLMATVRRIRRRRSRVAALRTAQLTTVDKNSAV